MASRRVNRPIEQKFKCLRCHEEKKKADFYKSYHDKDVNGIMPYCKKCAKEMCTDTRGHISRDLVVAFLRDDNVDRPFIDKLWEKSSRDKKETLGVYMRNLSLKQYQTAKWIDGNTGNYSGGLTFEDVVEDFRNGAFEVTPEIMDLFGEGYTDEEYKVMYRKYEKYSPYYPQPTPFHTAALLKYIRYSSKEEIATVQNRTVDAKFWGERAEKASKEANLNPSQLKDQDTKDGLSCFSKIYEEVEKAVDYVPLLPKFKYVPADAVDFIMYTEVSYLREVMNMGPCKYEDIYKFYDKVVEEYISSYGDRYGVFTDDPTNENREKIKKFLEECKEKVDG